MIEATGYPDGGWDGPDDPRNPSNWVRPGEWEPPGMDAVDLVVEAAGLVSVFTAQQYQRVDAMRRESRADAARHGYELSEVIERSIRLELAAALAVTEAAAGAMIAEADALINRFPGALDSLAHARITPRHASVLVEVMAAVEAEFHGELVPDAVALAEAHPVGTFRRLLRALVETVRASTLPERHERAVESRRAMVLPGSDGMADMLLRMPAVESHAIFERATRIAKTILKIEGEQRTLDQARLDVLTDLLIDGDTTHLPAEARGIRATVAVTVPALALLGHEGAGVATVDGVGPIPINAARELCGGAGGWMRVLTHPETGIVLSVGRTQYEPPAALRRLVKWRAGRCMAPGCNVPAARCEVDHTVAWDDGGHTGADNLCPLCKGHHTVKHHGRWRVQQIEGSGGALLWTSPTGRRYRVDPERKVPAFRPTDDESRPPF